jgi:hypothetical protein
VADGDDNNVVNRADFDIWRANYGSTIDAGAAGTAAVPEPATTLLLIATALVASVRRQSGCQFRAGRGKSRMIALMRATPGRIENRGFESQRKSAHGQHWT